MARTEQEVEAQVETAKKQVRFSLGNLAKHHPSDDKAPKTTVRRRSLDPTNLVSDQTARTETLQDIEEETPDANEEDDKPLDIRATEFDILCSTDKLASCTGMTLKDFIEVDLPNRLESLADYYGRRGRSPSMPFTPMTEEG